MKINRVTLTGADNNTPYSDLISLQKEFPFVEWGILVSTNSNRNRYPSEDYILGLKNKGLNLSLHLCGKYTRGILTDGIIDIPYDFFDRYQINFNFKHTPHNLNNYISLLEKYNKTFILQYNDSNDSYINALMANFELNHTNVLYDASGGRGTEIKSISDPFVSFYTGYSGGLNPENILAFCENISNFNDKSDVWIDMESGVRTDDIFDLRKVRKILEIASDFI